MQFMLEWPEADLCEFFRLAGFTDVAKAIRGRVDREEPDE